MASTPVNKAAIAESTRKLVMRHFEENGYQYPLEGSDLPEEIQDIIYGALDQMPKSAPEIVHRVSTGIAILEDMANEFLAILVQTEHDAEPEWREELGRAKKFLDGILNNEAMFTKPIWMVEVTRRNQVLCSLMVEAQTAPEAEEIAIKTRPDAQDLEVRSRRAEFQGGVLSVL